ncbi:MULTISPECIES: serine protease inhibitor ecotin [Chitinibacter]|uniref:serine protease inhibitor ecotin n=1 Tax=Chitinibacter TaxID=230666 RepID=UPI0004914C61|nr:MULTISPECIES: serine protease inhibitor ecotin [Chitinibacter]
MKLTAQSVLAGVLAAGLITPALAASDLQPFPPAKEGYVRKVIRLPEMQNPELYRVQLIPGQVIAADCNTRSLRAKIKEQTVQGWGYNYWTVGPVSAGPTTLMACPEGSKTERFVPVYNEQLIRYNAKLPLVVYVPEGVELQYRIWAAPEKAQVAGQE